MSRILDICPECGNEYFHVCAFAWCAWPCDKLWSWKELKSVYKKWTGKVLV